MNGFAVSVVAAGKNSDKNLHAAHLTGSFVHDFKLVASIVNIHLITSQMLHVANGAYLALVGTDGQFELSVLIAIQMFLLVLIMQ